MRHATNRWVVALQGKSVNNMLSLYYRSWNVRGGKLSCPILFFRPFSHIIQYFGNPFACLPPTTKKTPARLFIDASIITMWPACIYASYKVQDNVPIMCIRNAVPWQYFHYNVDSCERAEKKVILLADEQNAMTMFRLNAQLINKNYVSRWAPHLLALAQRFNDMLCKSQ